MSSRTIENIQESNISMNSPSCQIQRNQQSSYLQQNNQQNYHIDNHDNLIQSSLPLQNVPIILHHNRQSQIRNQQGLNIIQKQCRICLENQNDGKIIKPCTCIGSMSYAHQKCIKEWILKKMQSKIKTMVRCQVCNYQYRYKIVKDTQFSVQQLKKNKQANSTEFCRFFMLMGILTSGLIGLLIIYVLSTMKGNVGDSIRSKIIRSSKIQSIFGFSCLAYFAILCIILMIFLFQYGIIVTFQIHYVLDIRQKLVKARNFRIYPKFK